MNSIQLILEHDGYTLGELAGQWWNWFFSEPLEKNRLINNVLFLRGEREDKENIDVISISNDTPVFFPVIDTIMVPGCKGTNSNILKEECEMRRAILRESYSASAKVAILSNPEGADPIDIVEDGNWFYFRAESPTFRLIVPRNSPQRDTLDSPLPSESGEFEGAICGGFYLLIKSLPPAKDLYRIHFEAKGRHNYVNYGTYYIKVE